MIQRLHEQVQHVEHAPATPVDGAAGDGLSQIDSWLSALESLLHLPSGRRQAVHDELAEHLRHRCRELTLAGVNENEAVAKSVAELGEMAELARRLDRAHRNPTRRTMMYATLAGLGATTVATVALVFNSGPGSTVPASVFGVAETTDDAPALDISNAAEMSLRELVENACENSGLSLTADWIAIDEYGIDSEQSLDLVGDELRLDELFHVANQRYGTDNGLDWRQTGEILEVNTRDHFDRREMLLATYDIGDVLAIASREQIIELIQTFVSPNDWAGNGGSLARLQIVGGLLFIEAPLRMHKRIRWILSELDPQRERGEARRPRPVDAGGLGFGGGAGGRGGMGSGGAGAPGGVGRGGSADGGGYAGGGRAGGSHDPASKGAGMGAGGR